MNIETALTLKPGRLVKFPPSFGMLGGIKPVREVRPLVRQSSDGSPYVLVMLAASGTQGHPSVWSSLERAFAAHSLP